MFEHIVVPLDASKLSETILDYVTPLAKTLGAKVVLLHAVSDQYADAFEGVASVSEEVAGLKRSEQDAAKAYLNGVAERVKADGVEVDTHAEYGSPTAVILNYIAKRRPDLVAMSTNGRSGLKRMIVGSVTAAVLPHADAPMLVIHPQDDGKQQPGGALENVVVPLDMSFRSESILPVAMELSKEMNLSVNLVTCVPEPSRVYASTMPGMYPYSDDLMQQAEQTTGDYLAEVADNVKHEYGVDAGRELLHGSAASAIVRRVETTPNSLIAMSTNGRTGIGRWVLGSVTEAVVRSSGNPVLIVHSDDDGALEAQAVPAPA